MLFHPWKFRLVLVLIVVMYAGAFVSLMLRTPQGLHFTTEVRISQVLGFLGLTGVIVQFWLSSRARFLEQGVGLHRLLKLHSWNARTVLTILVLHPVVQFWPDIADPRLWERLWKAYDAAGYRYGIIALSLLLLSVGFTVFATKLHVPYERWRIVHKIGYVILFLGFLHSRTVGSDLAEPGPANTWWKLLIVLAVLAFLYRYGVRSIRLRRAWYRVTSVRAETDAVRTITVAPEQGQPFPYAAGQFAFWTFHSRGLPVEEHPFTISSAPDGKTLSVSPKASGDFTSQLDHVQVGDRVRVEGPYGVLSNAGMPGPFVFIAGGIGITPLHSMLLDMVRRGRTDRTVLLYANKTKTDIAFREELEALVRDHPWFTLVHVLSDEQVAGFRHGRIDRALVAELVPDVSAATFFIVGPPAMMDAIEKTARSLSVPKEKIFTERFALR